jgi:hypothetical protein
MTFGPRRRGWIVKYMLLLNRTADALPAPGSPELDQINKEYRAAVEAMSRAGVLIDCAPLAARSSTTTVRVRDGETIITDGPSAEIKEQLGGYSIIECADLDEALKWAASIPAARDASVEVRPIVGVQARA